jgi:hypothetical protein
VKAAVTGQELNNAGRANIASGKGKQAVTRNDEKVIYTVKGKKPKN